MKAAKKIFFNGRAAIKRGGGIKKKNFFGTFFILLPFLNKRHFTLDNLSTYRINFKFVSRFFCGFPKPIREKYLALKGYDRLFVHIMTIVEKQLGNLKQLYNYIFHNL